MKKEDILEVIEESSFKRIVKRKLKATQERKLRPKQTKLKGSKL